MFAPLPTQSEHPFLKPQPTLPLGFDPEAMPVIAMHFFGWSLLGDGFGHVPAEIRCRLFEMTAP